MMASYRQTHDGGGPGPQRTGPEGLPVLLDSRQWSYVRRRYELTPRELEIAELVCRGLRNDRIARDLKIRPGTVKAHVRNIYRKVKVRSKIAMLLRFVEEASGPAYLRNRGGAREPLD